MGTFNLEIVFEDLCAFTPTEIGGKKAGYMLLPEVRRPRNWQGGDPFHAHFPAVRFSAKHLDDSKPHPRLLHIKELPKNPRRSGQTEEHDHLFWFPCDVDLFIQTGRPNKEFQDLIDRNKIADFDKILSPMRQRLDPLLRVENPHALEPEDRKKFETKLNARVVLDDGLLEIVAMDDRLWTFAVPGAGNSPNPQHLAKSLRLSLTDIDGLTLRARPFSHDVPEEVLSLKPSDGQLSIRILNMTPEIYLGLPFDDPEFRNREKGRSLHFKLYYDLLKAPVQNRLIPKLVEPQDSVYIPNYIIFCPPVYVP